MVEKPQSTPDAKPSEHSVIGRVKQMLPGISAALPNSIEKPSDFFKDKGAETDEETRAIQSELNFIAKAHPDRAHVQEIAEALDGKQDETSQPYLFGMALSGGGIRSAVFCLGAIQKLAAAGIFKHVDYLSTVSGGGYCGSALHWWLSGKAREDGQTRHNADCNLPFGTSDPGDPGEEEEPILAYLRQHGNYLKPGNGITIISGIAVVLRAVLLNLLVWIPIAAFLFLCMDWIGHLALLTGIDALIPLPQDASLTPFFEFLISLGLLILAFFAVACANYSFVAFSRHKKDKDREKEEGERNLVKGAVLILGNLLFAAFCLAFLAIIIGFGNYFQVPLEALGLAASSFALFIVAQPGATLFNPVMTVLLFAGLVVILVWLSYEIGKAIRRAFKKRGVSERYSGRRAFEKLFGRLFAAAAALLVLGSVPMVFAILESKIGAAGGGITGLISVVGGTATAFWGFLNSGGKGGGGRFTKPTLAIGAALLIYGIMLVGFYAKHTTFPHQQNGAAVTRSEKPLLLEKLKVSSETTLQIEVKKTAQPENTQSTKSSDTAQRLKKGIFWFLLLIAVFSGWITNLNYISLGRFYRDRLMETFMPDQKSVDNQATGAAGRADHLKVHELWSKKANKKDGSGTVGPYPIINTNMVLVDSPTRKFKSRGGDNFVIAPHLSGSTATGWTPTESFDGGEMTLASAMAISGAAANPRAGVGGKGVTTNFAVSLVMTLLNFRLGYWVNRPRDEELTWWRTRPFHFYPSAFYSLPGNGYKETSDFLELSDGGHFENLGIYELIRRRCALIIVCDGGQDAAASYSDLVTAIQRVGQDFGARINFSDGFGPEQLVPKPRTNSYPKGAEYADQGYFVATIDYNKRGGGPWPEKGLLIYLKTAMINELSMTSKGYKGANPDFPDQSTGDQFFDEEQFEAYRDVGYKVAEQMVSELNLSRFECVNRELILPKPDNPKPSEPKEIPGEFDNGRPAAIDDNFIKRVREKAEHAANDRD